MSLGTSLGSLGLFPLKLRRHIYTYIVAGSYIIGKRTISLIRNHWHDDAQTTDETKTFNSFGIITASKGISAESLEGLVKVVTFEYKIGLP